MPNIPINQHNIEIQKNLESWNSKPVLRKIYNDFYKEILFFINRNIEGEIIELGSGIGNFKQVCPEAVATDIFQNPWIDRIESAYKLSSEDSTVSNIVMFDVFHHLEYLGVVFNESKRVLKKGGRIIIFDPYISLFGFLVYGLFHHEPVAFNKEINWLPNDQNEVFDSKYYAAQGNATRVFKNNSKFKKEIEKDWKVVSIKKFSALTYVLSGGFSKPALFPGFMFPLIKFIGKIADFFPWIFATRVLIVLEKR